jgi:hypothetical protein
MIYFTKAGLSQPGLYLLKTGIVFTVGDKIGPLKIIEKHRFLSIHFSPEAQTIG